MSPNQAPEKGTYSSVRNLSICEFYLTGRTQVDTAAQFGITAARVYQILRTEGVPPRTERTVRKKLIDTKPLSSFHSQLGQDVSYRRHKMNMHVKEFASAVGISKERLRSIEMGVGDPTLSEIAKLSKAMGVDIQVLTTPRSLANLSGAA
jgi:ribosome-binding protein aMBF1 (putative translation factor)